MDFIVFANVVEIKNPKVKNKIFRREINNG